MNEGGGTVKIEELIVSRRTFALGNAAYAVVSGGAAPERARALRGVIETAAATLEDAAALSAVELFPTWEADRYYEAGQRVRWTPQPASQEEAVTARLYKCVQAHTSQTDWTPEAVPALWTPVADPAEEWPAWVQPTGAQDAYPAGARVSYQGKHWVNTYGDGNIWAPGDYGWEEAVGSMRNLPDFRK